MLFALVLLFFAHQHIPANLKIEAKKVSNGRNSAFTR